MKTDRFVAKVRKKKIPIRTHFVPTWSCNLRCIHCYPYLRRDRDLTFREAKRKLDELASAGCLFLGFSGGEPLVRKDFLSIARYAAAKSFAISLDTNGTLITPFIADEIRRMKFARVRVTLLGATPAAHEQITGVKGSFQKSLNGVKLLKERGINLSIQITVMKENASGVGKIRDLARKMGVAYESSPFKPFSWDNGDPIWCR